MAQLLRNALKELSDDDKKLEMHFRKSGYHWVYTKDRKAFKPLSFNKTTNMLEVLDEDGEEIEIHIDTVSAIPNDADFKTFLENDLLMFDCFLYGEENTDPKMYECMKEVLGCSVEGCVADYFSKDQVFITNISSAHIIYNKNERVFNVYHLNETYEITSYLLALKLTYEYNKE